MQQGTELASLSNSPFLNYLRPEATFKSEPPGLAVRMLQRA
jgi:hypothetical protein